ncbi:MAG TPA: TonB family protein [Terracidiphilus sp.]|nr:TonB family protein [Terracidiphilus sp.]
MRRILATSTLLTSLVLPAAALASTPADDASAPTPIRVSSGVTQPVLVNSAYLDIPAGYSIDAIPDDAQVGLSLTVNEKGEPENIQVTKSYGKFWDARVISTVRQFKFKPATVDDQPTAVDMNLTINIAR